MGSCVCTVFGLFGDADSRGTRMCNMCNLRGRARGRDFPLDSPSHPGGRGRARALPLLPQAPLPTARVPRLRDILTSPLRHPIIMFQCLEPHGHFPSPSKYVPNGHLLMRIFSPTIPWPVAWYCPPIPCPCIRTSHPLSLTLHLPIPL